MSASVLVDQLLTALSTVVDGDDSAVLNAFRSAITPVVEAFVSSTGSTGRVSVKLSGATGSGATKTKRAKDTNKVSNKNAYHFFVASTMASVKAETAPKDRMGAIGLRWKEMSPEGKEPYQTAAKAYNEVVAQRSTGADLSSADVRKEIKAAAQSAALEQSGLSLDAEALDEVATTVTVPVPAPVPVPVPAPAPVQAPTGARRTVKSKQ